MMLRLLEFGRFMIRVVLGNKKSSWRIAINHR
jgi:hypothetical protein